MGVLVRLDLVNRKENAVIEQYSAGQKDHDQARFSNFLVAYHRIKYVIKWEFGWPGSGRQNHIKQKQSF